MTVCGSCGFANREGVRFCEECGFAVAPAALPPPQCSACGTVNRPGVVFCEECGQALAALAAASVPARRSRAGMRWAAAAVVVLAGAAIGAWLLFFADAGGTEEAARMADAAVAEVLPDFAGAPSQTTHLDDARYVVGYSIPADEAAGRPFDQFLHVYVDLDTDTVMMELSN